MCSSITRYNAQQGKLDGYDCPKCLNKGNRLTIVNGRMLYEECECLNVRRALRLIKDSGLGKSLEQCTFANFSTSADWQRHMRDKAIEYVEHPDGWFFIGGQVGSGKTHLCTAIVGELLKRGVAAKYCLWRDESTRLKGFINEPDYDAEIKKYKLAECLYIDDLFKVKHGTTATAADINLAFEILNYRYINGLSTIISSEKTVREIIEIDEAVGSRIYEMSKGRALNLSADKNKNYRINGGKQENER